MNAGRIFADISDYQTTFDAHAYRSAGHVLIAIKAGEGTGDGGATHYAERVKRAHHAGLTVIHYWFTRPENRDPRAQASAFAERVKNRLAHGDLLCLDVETGGGDNPHYFTLHCDNELVRLTGRHPVVYSYVSYLRMYNVRASGKALWVASYDGRRLPSSLPWISGQRRWAKQFTDSYHFAGIGRTDASCLSLGAYRQIMRNHGRHVVRHRR